MYLEVYPDVIFALNFFLDFIVLTILKMINRKEGSKPRRILASVVGAIAAAVVGIDPWMNIIIRFIFLNIGAALLMLLLAFGRMKLTDLLKQMISLYLITYVTGGLINSIYYNTNLRMNMIRVGDFIQYSNAPIMFIVVLALLLIPAVRILLYLHRWFRSNRADTMEVELILEDRSIKTKGLMDSGNCLYEPIVRKPVIIIENQLLTQLLSLQLLQDFEIMKEYIEGRISEDSERFCEANSHLQVKMIPYQSVGRQSGMMPAIVLDKVILRLEKETVCNERVTAAICDNSLSTKEEYHVILHKELLSF